MIKKIICLLSVFTLTTTHPMGNEQQGKKRKSVRFADNIQLEKSKPIKQIPSHENSAEYIELMHKLNLLSLSNVDILSLNDGASTDSDSDKDQKAGSQNDGASTDSDSDKKQENGPQRKQENGPQRKKARLNESQERVSTAVNSHNSFMQFNTTRLNASHVHAITSLHAIGYANSYSSEE